MADKGKCKNKNTNKCPIYGERECDEDEKEDCFDYEEEE